MTRKNGKFKKKIPLISFLIIFLLLSISGSAYFMVIDVIQEKAGAVFFPHSRHLKLKERGGAGLACDKCHHELNQTGTLRENPSVCVSAQCHPADKKTAKSSGKIYIKNAFHNLCKRCHKNMRTRKAPTNCSGCHKKELSVFSEVRKQKNISE